MLNRLPAPQWQRCAGDHGLVQTAFAPIQRWYQAPFAGSLEHRDIAARPLRLPDECRAIAYGSVLGGGNARAACSTSPRVRGEVDLRAESWRREANRVRGLVHNLRLAATPPHPDSFAALGIRPLPARGERWRKWLCLAPPDTNSNAIALLTNWGGPDHEKARHVR